MADAQVEKTNKGKSPKVSKDTKSKDKDKNKVVTRPIKKRKVKVGIELLYTPFDNNKRQIKKIQKVVKQINELEKKYESFTQDEMKQATQELRDKMQEILPLDKNIDALLNSKTPVWFETKHGKEYLKKLMKILPQAFAVFREASKRVTNHRHFDVQVMAGIVLSQGRLSELATGEGKTQVAGLALYLYALAGRGATLVTVNDYLAKLHAEWMGHIMDYLGMKVGCVISESAYKFVATEELEKNGVASDVIEKARDLESTYAFKTGNVRFGAYHMKGYNMVETTKKEAYECDVTYSLNSELGFDHLRDNLVKNHEDTNQRELFFCVVDEADSILIDESRVPLIISNPNERSNELYYKFARIVSQLSDGEYDVDEKDRVATPNEKGIEKLERLLGVSNIFDDNVLAHFLNNAMQARFMFHKDKEYIVKNGEILLVDEFTGRTLQGRRYSHGLHEAIEAKENLPIQKQSSIAASITYQNFFRMFKVLAGMTGTAVTEAEEFHKIYKLDVVVTPTNRPVVRKDLTDVIYKTEKAKFNAVLEDIKERHARHQPVLVGTASVDKSEVLSLMLAKEGIKHEVLNAKNHMREAEIVEHAGEKDAITISTNMAGRGTDIKLGDGVVELGGLHVIGTERHESRRIDNQLRGRAGRQGDHGSSRFYVSLEDRLMRVFGGNIVKKFMDMTRIPEDFPIENKIIARTITSSQKRMEGNNFDIRKTLVDYDNVLNTQRKIVYKRRRNILKKSSEDPLFIKKYIHKKLAQRVKALVLDATIDKKKITKSVIEDLLKRFKDIFGVEPIFDDVITKKLESKPEVWLELLTTNPSREKCIEQFRIFLENAYAYKEELNGSEFTRKIEQNLLLDSVDLNWQSHLDAMDDLRHTVNLRAYGQKDPLVEYKNEGFDLFHEMLDQIDGDVISRILRINAINVSEREYQAVDLNAINNAVETIKNVRSVAGFRPAGDILSDKSKRKKDKRKNKNRRKK
ncbi:MAG: preprotein translocase subunit SecA [bacterium]